jgi:hypothetical protein
MFKHAAQTGSAGVGKHADSWYVGGRSKDWLKSKPARYHDGWERPTRKREGLRQPAVAPLATWSWMEAYWTLVLC